MEKKKLIMQPNELDCLPCTEDERKSWEELAKKNNWKWGIENFIRMKKHMKYLCEVLEYCHSSCESPPELIAYDSVRRAGVNPHLQTIMLSYRVDQFYYYTDDIGNEISLVVEIDGSYTHSTVKGKMEDTRKTKDLLEEGISVLRFTAKEVFKDPNKIGVLILGKLNELESEGKIKVMREVIDDI